jgi:hypothetical protein
MRVHVLAFQSTMSTTMELLSLLIDLSYSASNGLLMKAFAEERAIVSTDAAFRARRRRSGQDGGVVGKMWEFQARWRRSDQDDFPCKMVAFGARWPLFLARWWLSGQDGGVLGVAAFQTTSGH